ncbi:hypothetical protein [Streptacidiphilus sp. PAMC 29251]
MAGSSGGIMDGSGSRDRVGRLTFFRQIGGSVALAIAGSLYADTLTHNIGHGLHHAQATATASALPWLCVIGATATFLAAAVLPPPAAPSSRTPPPAPRSAPWPNDRRS